MDAPIITKEKVQVNVADEVLGFSLKVGGVACALIGAWAVSCLLAGLIRFGAVDMIKGYVSAITGF